MKWNPYLNFNGNCQEAFKYYERVLGGKDRRHDEPRRHAGGRTSRKYRPDGKT